jgi:curli biogenesis system outer membrane secretion channel CsgG
MMCFKRISMFTVVVLCLFVSTTYAKDRVAVMEFENKTPHGGWRVGQGASDMLATALVKVEKFTVFERDKIDAVLKEQDFGASGRIDPTTAAKIGKLIGVEYIITGAVTEYGQSDSDYSGGGKFSVGKKGYHAAVDVRMVNVNTGEIVFADSGSSSKSALSVEVFGFGGGDKFNEKKATEALRGAIDEVSDKIDTAPLNALENSEPKGPILVAAVDGTTLSFNNGSNAGLEVDQEVTVSRKDKIIKDPATGKVLKVKYKQVGRVKLTSVETSYAEGQTVSGSAIQVGDEIK